MVTLHAQGKLYARILVFEIRVPKDFGSSANRTIFGRGCESRIKASTIAVSQMACLTRPLLIF